MICIECNGSGHTWYGNHSAYATCEICGGGGYLDDRGYKRSDAPETPLWPIHDQKALNRKS